MISDPMPKARHPNSGHQRQWEKKSGWETDFVFCTSVVGLNCEEIKQDFILTEIYSISEVKPFGAFRQHLFLSYIFLYVRYLTFILSKKNAFHTHTHTHTHTWKGGLALLGEQSEGCLFRGPDPHWIKDKAEKSLSCRLVYWLRASCSFLMANFEQLCGIKGEPFLTETHHHDKL